MKKHRLSVAAFCLFSSMSIFADEGNKLEPVIIAEVVMTELADNGIATVIPNESCGHGDSCKMVVYCKDDPNVEACIAEDLPAKENTKKRYVKK